MMIGLLRWTDNNDWDKRHPVKHQKVFSYHEPLNYFYDIIQSVINSQSRYHYQGNYGVTIRNGDIITMCINLYESTLSFRVNGRFLGISHKLSSEPGHKYKIAIYMNSYSSMSDNGGIIEIMDDNDDTSVGSTETALSLNGIYICILHHSS